MVSLLAERRECEHTCSTGLTPQIHAFVPLFGCPWIMFPPWRSTQPLYRIFWGDSTRSYHTSLFSHHKNAYLRWARKNAVSNHGFLNSCEARVVRVVDRDCSMAVPCNIKLGVIGVRPITGRLVVTPCSKAQVALVKERPGWPCSSRAV